MGPTLELAEVRAPRAATRQAGVDFTLGQLAITVSIHATEIRERLPEELIQAQKPVMVEVLRGIVLYKPRRASSSWLLFWPVLKIGAIPRSTINRTSP